MPKYRKKNDIESVQTKQAQLDRCRGELARVEQQIERVQHRRRNDPERIEQAADDFNEGGALAVLSDTASAIASELQDLQGQQRILKVALAKAGKEFAVVDRKAAKDLLQERQAEHRQLLAAVADKIGALITAREQLRQFTSQVVADGLLPAGPTTGKAVGEIKALRREQIEIERKLQQ